MKGKRIVVTRSREQAAAFCAKLAECGAEPIAFPVIAFVPLKADLEALAQKGAYDWLLFTSVNAVNYYVAQQVEIRAAKIGAVGSATAVRLAELGRTPDFMPQQFTGEQLALGLGDVTEQRILLPRAKGGRPEIVNLLRQRGAQVDDVALYDTVQATPAATAWADLAQGADVVTFTSPSSVRNFVDLLAKAPAGFVWEWKKMAVACIGPSTQAEAEKFGLTVDIVPQQYRIDDLIEAIEAVISKQ
ncbi:MAG: uroporphyrinogen-III synthase [Chloroflexota bacterium]